MGSRQSYWVRVFCEAWDQTPTLRPRWLLGPFLVSILAGAFTALGNAALQTWGAGVLLFLLAAWVVVSGGWLLFHVGLVPVQWDAAQRNRSSVAAPDDIDVRLGDLLASGTALYTQQMKKRATLEDMIRVVASGTVSEFATWDTARREWAAEVTKYLEEQVGTTDAAQFMDLSDPWTSLEDSDIGVQHSRGKDELRKHIKNLRQIIDARRATIAARAHAR